MKLHPRMRDLEGYAGGASRGRLAAHLADCPSCRSTVSWVRDVRAALGEPTIVRAPDHAWTSIRTRLDAGETVLLPSPKSERTARGAGPRARIAAVALLVAAAGAAAALPGSPIRELVVRALAADGRATEPEPAPAAAPGEAGSAVPALRFTVPPESGAIEVAIVQPVTGLRLRVRWADAGRLELHAAGGAAGAQFRSSAGRMTVSSAGVGEIVIVVPRAVPRVAVTVDGVPHLLQRDGTVTVNAPVADTIDGEIVIPLGPSPAVR